jgi:hypothetical protein
VGCQGRSKVDPFVPVEIGPPLVGGRESLSGGSRATAGAAPDEPIGCGAAFPVVAGWGRGAERRSAGLQASGASGWSGCFGLAGGWAAAEVADAQAVAVAFQGEDLGVVDEPVDHGDGDDLVAEDLAPGGEGLVGGDDQGGAFVAAADERNIRLAAWASKGM